MSKAGRYGRLFSFRHLDRVGLQFSGDVSFEMPTDVVYSDLYAPRQFFFRVLLKKK
ncbi:hypothetical protein [Brevibacillus sp. HB1.3]|uniref:hypothetical protein n=1 Tax=Brevibacillus sp. HB1.3 TaxID=2738842 RepID=UPI0020A67477|nr:hypothetical protein [Brevibacillus sp. HB1.3]